MRGKPPHELNKKNSKEENIRNIGEEENMHQWWFFQL